MSGAYVWVGADWQTTVGQIPRPCFYLFSLQLCLLQHMRGSGFRSCKANCLLGLGQYAHLSSIRYYHDTWVPIWYVLWCLSIVIQYYDLLQFFKNGYDIIFVVFFFLAVFHFIFSTFLLYMRDSDACFGHCMKNKFLFMKNKCNNKRLDLMLCRRNLIPRYIVILCSWFLKKKFFLFFFIYLCFCLNCQHKVWEVWEENIKINKNDVISI